MTTISIIITSICALVLVKLFHKLYKWYQYSVIINKIPGPNAYPLVGNGLTVLRMPRKERYRWNRGLWKKYNDGIFRIWFGVTANVNLTTAENISPIVSNKKLITKSRLYDFIRPWLGQGLLTSTGDLWHRQRKLITPTFHFEILMQYSEVISQKAEILKEIVESELKTNPNKPIDMFELLTRCGLDIISEAAMGVNVNAQTDYQSEYFQAIHDIGIQAFERIFQPWLHSDRVYYRTSNGKKFQRTVGIIQKFTNKVINQRKLGREISQNNSDKNKDSDEPKRQTFLDHLLDACERENMPLTNDELREQVNTFLFAGHDTTAAGMSWALFCISNNPEVEKKIHEEQLLVFGDSTEPATVQQIAELKYLERVIKETLRLFPSVPAVGRLLTEDVEIAGYEIPKGSLIGIMIQAIHFDPKHWPDPEKFDPDRFLPENSQGRHPYAYLPFSAGPRNCIGQKFALLEQKIVLTALLRKWRVKCPVKYEEMEFYHELILKPQNGVNIYFTPK